MTSEQIIIELLLAARNTTNIVQQLLLRDAAEHISRLAMVTANVADVMEACQVRGNVSNEQWTYWIEKCRAATGNLP
jgi:hypothetical protein